MASQKQKTAEKEIGILELVQAMGAKSFDPMPPDQHSCWQEIPGAPPLVRMWSVMCACTIAYGRRSPYAVDEKGNPLTIAGLSKLVGMELPNTYRTWKEGVATGLWRDKTERDGEGELFLCGTVRAAEDTGEQPSDQPVSDCLYRQFPAFVQKRLKPYIVSRIDKLPTMQKVEFLVKFTRDVRLELDLHAEVTAAVRLISERRQDSTFHQFGLKKIREEHKNGTIPAEESAAREKRVKALARKLKLSVQTIETQYTPAEALYETPDGKYEVRGGVVQPSAAAPSFNTETETEQKSSSSSSVLVPPTTTFQAAATEPPGKGEDWVQEAMSAYARKPYVVDKFAVQQLVAACREKIPDITYGEICDQIHAKGALSNRAANPIGAMIRNVPGFLDAADLAQKRAEKAEVAHQEEQRIRGLHQQLDAEAELELRTEQEWGKDSGRRQELRARAEAELRADPATLKRWRYIEEGVQRQEIETRAMRMLRDSLSKSQAGGAS